MAQISPLKPGSKAPSVRLINLQTGAPWTLEDAADMSILIINFWSVECPWCEQYDTYFAKHIPAWAAESALMVMALSNYDESQDAIMEKVRQLGLNIPILYDEGNQLADAFGAITTPHLFLLDATRIIRYVGAVDDRTFVNKTMRIPYLENAIEQVRNGNEAELQTTPAFGCTINRIIR